MNSDYPFHNYSITLKEAQEIGLNAKEMNKELNSLLFEPNNTYSKMAKKALTDYDENNYHNHEILQSFRS